MCYVSYQIDRNLAAEDREDARNERLQWLAELDSYSLYLSDAVEAVEFEGLSERDSQILEDTGDFSFLSEAGKEKVQELAEILAAQDEFSRYDE